MMAKGYVATSLDEICQSAGVTKGSFFHYFKNKEALGQVLVARFSERQGDRFREAIAGVQDPLERVYAMLDMVVEAARSPEMKGCLVGTFAQELWETHPTLREACRCSFDAVSAAVAQDLIDAKARYAADAPFDAASLGACFVSLAQGSMLLFKTNADGEAFANNMIHFRDYLKSLYGT